VNDQFQVPEALPPRKNVNTNWLEGWVDPRAGLDN